MYTWMYIPEVSPKMKTITITDFRKSISSVITQVEQGERILILRRGKPVAEISALPENRLQEPAWKRPIVPLEIEGASLSAMILEERSEDAGSS